MARHCKSFCTLAAIAWGLVLTLGSGVARAYDEQASIDMALGYALLADESPSLHGAALDLGASVGLSEAIVARSTLGYAAYVDRHDIAQLGRLRLEGIYLLDVLRFVPFVGLGATLTTNPDASARLPLRVGGHVVLGVDYLLSRSWTLGLDVRSALLVEGRGERLNATDVSLRISRMFETF